MTDNSKPDWAKALDLQAQGILDNINVVPSYVNVTLQEYGYFDNPLTHQLAYKFKLDEWMEQDKKRKAYYESPEGKAELEAARLAGIKEAKRLAKVQKRWQWLHDKLAAKGCECNHDWCGDY